VIFVSFVVVWYVAVYDVVVVACVYVVVVDDVDGVGGDVCADVIVRCVYYVCVVGVVHHVSDGIMCVGVSDNVYVSVYEVDCVVRSVIDVVVVVDAVVFLFLFLYDGGVGVCACWCC